MPSTPCAAWRAALLLLAVPAAVAQTSAPPPATTPASAASSPSAYRSAFEGYRRFDDQPIAPWRESNGTVGRIGGWRSYAREGQGGEPAPGASAPAAAGAPSGHPGHVKP